jgi:predicted flap endonuclease-1-like 5' DNA nuclease
MSLPSSLLLAPVVSGLASRLASPAAAEAEGNPWWLWIVVFIILVAFGAFMLWWWLRSPGEEAEVPSPPVRSETGTRAPSPGISVLPEMASTPEPKPEAEPVPAVTEPGGPRVDDLKIVEGIGPKIAAVLRDAGVTTFAQLASVDPERLRQILRDRDPNLLRLADPTTWPEQARLAAEGEWEALAGYQQELKGGRRV